MNYHEDPGFDRWVSEALSQEQTLDPKVLERVRERASAPEPQGAFRSLLTTIQGASIMKKTAWTTAGAIALIVGITALSSPVATAATAKAKFAAMKKALAAQQGKVSLQISTDFSGGKPKTVAVINGHMVEIQDGVPFEFHDGNTNVSISSSSNVTTSGMENLSPEERARIEKMIQEAMANAGQSGTASQTVVINGKELQGKEKEEWLKKHGGGITIKSGPGGIGAQIDIDFDFNFNESAYSTMTFGGNENTLLLTPKKNNGTRYALVLDPKTNLPAKVTLQKSKAGKWTTVRDSSFQYKPSKKGSKFEQRLDPRGNRVVELH